MKPGTNASEQAIIKSIGGRPHKNSGRGTKKGDGSWNYFTVDVKESQKSFTINKDVWGKVCTDAISNRADPMILLVLDGKTRIAMIEMEVLEELTDRIKE